MLRTKLSALCVLATHLGLAQGTQTANALVFRNVTVIDTVAGKARPAMTVVISGNRISQVGPSSITVPENARIISGDGKYLIPGLWDMHMHAIGNPGFREFVNPLLIANGVTGARSMGRTTLADILHERDVILRGEVIGPRIVASSLILDGPYPVWPEAAAVKSPESAKQLVDQQKKEGADFIKIYSLLGRPEFFALADEAKQQRISFVGHVPMAVKASEASKAGMKSMEHLYGVLEESSSEADELLARDEMNRQQFLSARAQGSKDPFLGLLESLRIWNRAALTHDPERAYRLYKTFAANRTSQVPTLVQARDWAYEDEPDHFSHEPYQYLPYKPAPLMRQLLTDKDTVEMKKAFTAKLAIVKEMQRAGVQILAGTDGPPFLVSEELELLVRAGLSTLEALRTATLNPAVFMGRTAELGSVESGKLADLVLLTSNPLDNIRAVGEIDTVVFNGRCLTRPQIDTLLADLATKAAPKPEKQH